ncbi:response regulator [Rubrivivax gelatinosus]|uniref:response regulator n=1 Tax=Rubrivivax gelatinosus TaxID=28068 RepID=UPI0031FA3FC1
MSGTPPAADDRPAAPSTRAPGADSPRWPPPPDVPSARAAPHSSLFEDAPVGLLTLQADGSVDRVNRRALRLLGPGAGFGRDIVSFAAPAGRSRLRAALEAAATAEASTLDLEFHTPCGTGSRQLMLALRRDPADAGRLLAALVDVDERHRAERELRQLHDRLQCCQRAAGAGAWSCDGPASALWLSDGARDLLGDLADAATLVQLCAGFSERDERENARRSLEAARNAGAGFVFDARVRGSDGARRWLRFIAAPQPGGAGLLGCVQDVEAQVQAEQLRLAQARAEVAEREGATLHARCRDVRTALQAMLGYAHLLARDPALSASATAAARVARVEAAARELLEIVKERAAPAPAAGGAGVPRHILYIEDNAVNAELMIGLLEARAPLRVEVAASGRRGLDRALELLPDLVLVDLQLPDLPGLELLRRLKTDPRTAGLTCLAVSAEAGSAEAAAARAAGASAFLAKPLDVDALLAAVDRFVPGLEVVAG